MSDKEKLEKLLSDLRDLWNDWATRSEYSEHVAESHSVDHLRFTYSTEAKAFEKCSNDLRNTIERITKPATA